MSESLPRQEETNDSSTDPDKSSSVECPTCGRTDFKSERGVKLHHKRAHGESLAFEETTCKVCGSVFEYRMAENHTGKYCSHECHGKGKFIENVEKDCEWCGDSYRPQPSQRDESRFCSVECRREWHSESFSGESHPNWKGRVQVDCSSCGEEFDVPHWRAQRTEKIHCSKDCQNHSETVCKVCDICDSEFEVGWWRESTAKFCSKPCLRVWMSEYMRGSNNPNWIQGRPKYFYYGPNWEEQKIKRRIEDQSRCQSCGKTPMENGRELSVHHIKRLGWFKGKYDAPDWYEKGNDLSNLVTLCRSCHGPWEKIGLRPQYRFD